MHDPLRPRPRPLERLATLTGLVGWGLWLRVAAADLVQWYCERKGLLCVFPDTNLYWFLAGKVRRGEPYEVVDWGDLPHFAVRTPGYPLFLAACQLAFGARVLPVRLVQAALGAWCVWLVARLVRRALPGSINLPGSAWTVPLIAAALTALDPFVVSNSAFVLSEALFLPLMLLAQWGFAVLWTAGEDASAPALSRKRAAGWALLTGAASGAAVLTRPSWALYVPVALAVWVVLSGSGWRTAAWRAGLVALALAVVMAPWWVRNARLYGKFVPTALWMGASLYDGLSPRATGASDMTFLEDPEFWPLDEEAQDAALRDRAIAFARANPGRVLRLAAVKAARFWSPWPNAEAFSSPALAVASCLVTLPQFALMALGVWDRRRDRRALVLLGLPLVYVFLLHLVFVSSMRYRIPASVPALGLAAVGLKRVVTRGKRMSDG
jgi:4-amino-4-deoxy-L-arabinose transferase-like glycosyltransferase